MTASFSDVWHGLAEKEGPTEKENEQRLRTRLEPHFDVYAQVHIREPIFGVGARIDFLLIAPDGLLDAGFPFDCVGVEVKRGNIDGRIRRHALHQCMSYRRCMLVDQRLAKQRGCLIPAVALYSGEQSRYGVARVPDDWYGGEVRLAGTDNVGVFVHGSGGLTLEISAERIWSATRGVTGVGANWPTTRRFANGKKRVQ